MPQSRDSHRRHVGKRQQCSGLYTHPAADETVQAYTPYEITWNQQCFDVDNVDLYLYEIGGNGPVKLWRSISVAETSFETEFAPSWWNATNAGSYQLRMQFVTSGDPAWASNFAYSSPFTVAWNGTTPVIADNPPTWNNTVESIHGGNSNAVTGGKLAAAVLFPILALFAAAGAYIFWSRRKSKTATKRWSAVIDKRMSQISQTSGGVWQASNGSVTGLHNRNGSSYSFAVGDNSFGSQSVRNSHAFSAHQAQPSGDGFRDGVAGDRMSRVSFAQQTSPPKDRKAPSRPESVVYPKIGRNRDVLGPLSPEQESPQILGRNAFGAGHRSQLSTASSLRNEVARNSNMFNDAELAAAVSVIKGESSLNIAGQSTRDSSMYNISNHSAQASIGSHHLLSPSEPSHRKQESIVSLKMPRLHRDSSLSPDDALAAYSRAKDKKTLPVQTHLTSRSLPGSSSMPVLSNSSRLDARGHKTSASSQITLSEQRTPEEVLSTPATDRPLSTASSQYQSIKSSSTIQDFGSQQFGFAQ